MDIPREQHTSTPTIADFVAELKGAGTVAQSPDSSRRQDPIVDFMTKQNGSAFSPLLELLSQTSLDVRKTATGAQILASSPDTQLSRLRSALYRFSATTGHPLLVGPELRALGNLARCILRRKLPYSADDIEDISRSCATSANNILSFEFPWSAVISQIQRFVYLHGMTPKLEAVLEELRENVSGKTSSEFTSVRANLDALLGSRVPAPDTVADVEPRVGNEAIAASLLVSEFLNEKVTWPDAFGTGSEIWCAQLSYSPSGKAIADAPNAIKVAALIDALERCSANESDKHREELHFIAIRLLRTPLEYRPDDLSKVLTLIAGDTMSHMSILLDGTFWPIVEANIERRGLSPSLRATLVSCRTKFASHAEGIPSVRALAHQMNRMLGLLRPGLPEPGEAWAEQVLIDIDSLYDTERPLWTAICSASLDLRPTNPPKRFLAESAKRVQAIGLERYATQLSEWVEMVAEEDLSLSDRNATILKGLVWHLISSMNDDHCVLLGAIARASFVKIPNIGARCKLAGNAAVTGLCRHSGQRSNDELRALFNATGYETVKERVAAALKARGVDMGFVTKRQKYDALIAAQFEIFFQKPN